MIRISFTAEYYKEGKDFHWLSSHEDDVWKEFSSGLAKLWTKNKLPSLGSLSFKHTEKGIVLISKKSLVINGVSVQKRLLKAGDRIIIGPLRVFYNSFDLIEEQETTPHIKPSIRNKEGRKYLLLAALVIAAVVSGIIVGCNTIPNIKKTMATVEKQRAPLRVEVPAETDLEEFIEHLLVIPPGGSVPDFDLDILFIHAHPDDEALDFGGLMALANSGRLKTGLVTFTDGESGLDTYPDRPVTGVYPNHNMEGAELAEVRSRELARAASVLGIDLLIRLGLKNHPYNSIKDELPPDEILEAWGGKEYLAGILQEIINKTTPETVVAPEAPGKAREHFEHEAVGYISAEVMNSIMSYDPEAPKRFITCIDPRQHQLYPNSSMIDTGLQVKKSRFLDGKYSLRDIQLSALSMHKTQNDAVNVGTGFLPEYPAEYYQIHNWHEPQPWKEWITSLSY